MSMLNVVIIMMMMMMMMIIVVIIIIYNMSLSLLQADGGCGAGGV